jgi:hypothetical protein
MSAIAPGQPTIPASDPGWVPSRLYRMSVDEYEAMVESGGLSPAPLQTAISCRS